MRYIVIFLFFLTSFYASGQFVFKYTQSVPVKENGKTLAMPWAGGLNAIQYNTADLNADGVEDLVLFDRTSNKISTYLAEDHPEGHNYVYAPDYEAYFPRGMTNWVIMGDYDCDGKKDIFTSSPFGIRLYHNVSNGRSPAWRVSVDPVTTLGSRSIINLQVNGSDIPAIEDVDGDGDLDILMFGISGGGTIQYHQNFSIERTGSCGVPDFERITTSWGDFTECGCDTFVFGGLSCGASGARELHAGGKSLLAYDMDGDGDMEVVLGDEDCNTLYLFENKGSATKAVIDSFVPFPNSTNPASFVSFPAAYLADVNLDGKKDLLVSPNRSSNTVSAPSDFQNSNWMYDNTGSDGIANFQFRSHSFLQDAMIDHGNNASVAFADEDGDGDLDMLVTSHGKTFGVSLYNSTISLYRNIGTATSPAFELVERDYLTFSALQYSHMKLQIADMNADGKKDLIVATTPLNTLTYTVFYLLNKSQNRLDFTGQRPKPINTRLLVYDNPYFFDVNRDGLSDLLVGRSNGSLSFFKNVGSAASPDFRLETAAFYQLGSSLTNRHLIPATGDLDANGHVELVTTDGRGQLTIYEDFLTHIDAPLKGITNVYFNSLTKTLTPFRLGMNALPVVTDLFGSGRPLIVLGTAQGGIQLLQNTDPLPAGFRGSGHLLGIFPNPGIPNVNNGIIEITSKEPLFVKIVSVSGSVIYSSIPVTPVNNIKLSVDLLSSGMYLAVGERNGKIVDQVKFIVTN